jgi:hydroxyacylglutathione hydrolase
MPLKVHTIRNWMAPAYLIEYEQGLALVDTGGPGAEHRLLRTIQELGRGELRLIFITHAHLDHYGNAAAVRSLTGAPLAVHPADAPAMQRGETIIGSARGRGRLAQRLMPFVQSFLRPTPTNPDLLLEDGQDLSQFGFPAVVLHTPGHTIGSCCLVVDGHLVFAGDLISNTGRPHFQRYYAQDWSQLALSLGRLISLQPEWIYPGHGLKPISGRTLQNIHIEATDEYQPG